MGLSVELNSGMYLVQSLLAHGIELTIKTADAPGVELLLLLADLGLTLENEVKKELSTIIRHICVSEIKLNQLDASLRSVLVHQV